MQFIDRLYAGRQLAEKLMQYKESKAIILAIPRGGVEVGYALAAELHLPLGVIVAKKIPYPGNAELAIGAVCEGAVSLDNGLIAVHNISSSYIEHEVQRIKSGIKERYKRFGKLSELKGRIVILTDDGIATGHTFFAAVDFIKKAKPKKVIAAVPVASAESLAMLEKKVDELVVVEKPKYFYAVGEFYRTFKQVSDEEVVKYLAKAEK